MTTISQGILAEGKTKILQEDLTPGQVRVSFKDAATAFNGGKYAEIPGKGALNARISVILFELLNRHGIPTCFVSQGDQPDELVYRKLSMIPLEVVVRNAAYGSVRKRFNLEEGQPFRLPLVEYFWKSDAANDPQIVDGMIGELKILPPGVRLDELERRALQINELFVAYFEGLGIRCADFKLEFGVDDAGKLYLGDELSPDNFRLRDLKTAQVLDKDVFRLDLADLAETYRSLLSRMEAGSYPELTRHRIYWAEVLVNSRKNILNPESRAVLNSLHTVGYPDVEDLRAGKRFEIRIQAPTMIAAEAQVLKIAEDILSNPVIEDFAFRLSLMEELTP